MIQVKIDPRILEACPECRIGLISATVVNEPTSDELWAEIEAAAEDIKQRYELLEINQRPAIAGTRHLYKSLGKDPSRYRVSSEALCRRIIRGLGLYRITSLIDDLCLGYKLPGAGGGGYLYMVAKDPEAAARIKQIINQAQPNPNARFVDMTLSKTGLQISRS